MDAKHEGMNLIQFTPEVMSIFKPSMDLADNGHPFEWSTVTDAINDNRKRGELPRKEFCRLALYLFERYRCMDIHLIAEILLIADIADQKATSIIRLSRIIACNFSYIELIDHKDSMMLLMKLKHKEIKNCYPLDPVRDAFSNGNLQWLKILLRYGVAYLPPQEDACEWTYASAIVQVILWHLEISFGQVGFFSTIDKHYPSESRQRLLTVLGGMEAIAHSLQESSTCHIQCLRKIFQTIPEPHITSAEIRRFLSHLLNTKESDSVILVISDKFEQELPESTGAYQPRTLRHLSRCTVRQSLREAGTLPHGVDQLQIPEVLKMYLMIMEKGETFYLM